MWPFNKKLALDHLGELAQLRESICPDCKASEWLGGPEGGIAKNYMCANCGSEFNITIPLGKPKHMMAHRRE